ncbi:hypothetical protein Agub_g684, partial [Astrephomene gubernaculifera]
KGTGRQLSVQGGVVARANDELPEQLHCACTPYMTRLFPFHERHQAHPSPLPHPLPFLALSPSSPPRPQPNPEVSQSSSFRLRHLRPGTVSLALGESDEDPAARSAPGYRPVEFLITTGPGPVPRLDGQNIVFGRVLEGMGVVGQVAQVPVFGPSPVGNSLAFNSLAAAIGDERAATVRRKYGKPLKAVVVLAAEVLPEVPAQ